MHEGITANHVKAFLLNLMVAGNYPGSFAWNETMFKRALVDVARASLPLRRFVSSLLMQGSRADDGKQMFEHVKGELITLWLDAVNPDDPESKARISDEAIRLARELRYLLTSEQLGELKRHGPDFMRALSAA